MFVVHRVRKKLSHFRYTGIFIIFSVLLFLSCEGPGTLGQGGDDTDPDPFAGTRWQQSYDDSYGAPILKRRIFSSSGI